MKIPYFLILAFGATVAHAEPPSLPPVLDNSTYGGALPQPTSGLPSLPDSVPSLPSLDSPPPAPAPAPTLAPVNSDLDLLKIKLLEQEKAIYELRRSNQELQEKVTGKKKKTAASKQPALDTTVESLVPKKGSSGVVSEKELYAKGSGLLKKGNYSQAVAEFQNLIKINPTGSYADNAQYWIGVALTNKGDKKGAVKAFDRLARNYPQSEKTPEGLYKLGTVLLSSDNKAKAKEYFDYIIDNYPGTNAAALAAKKKKQEKL